MRKLITKDTTINKARLTANIPLEFKTGQIIGNLSRVGSGAGGTDDRGPAAVEDLLYGAAWLGQRLLEGGIQSWGPASSTWLTATG